MRFPRELSVFAIVLLCGLAACTSNQDPQALKEKTAQATAELIAKPFEPTEMKEVLAQMLGLPQDWPLPEHLSSSVRH